MADIVTVACPLGHECQYDLDEHTQHRRIVKTYVQFQEVEYRFKCCVCGDHYTVERREPVTPRE